MGEINKYSINIETNWYKMVQIKKSSAVSLENDQIDRINYGFIKSQHKRHTIKIN